MPNTRIIPLFLGNSKSQLFIRSRIEEIYEINDFHESTIMPRGSIKIYFDQLHMGDEGSQPHPDAGVDYSFLPAFKYKMSTNIN